MPLRRIWTRDDILCVMRRPLLELVFDAAVVHRQHHDPQVIHLSSLNSIKTGGCPEDCHYCPQAARYATGINRHGLLDTAEVVDRAKEAKLAGASRICLGAAWRKVRDNKDFDRVIEMVREIADLDLEVCCTLGILTETQARRLKEAGLHAYNHNIDTSRNFYEAIISTRTYDDRLETLRNVRKAGLSVCCGGIIGMGESDEDRADMLLALASFDPPPESVPINALVPVQGTPLGGQETIDPWEVIRMVAATRIVLPRSIVRLSAGRARMSAAEQALCLLAGANSIFAGDRLLTTPNPNRRSDETLFRLLGLQAKAPFMDENRPIEQEG